MTEASVTSAARPSTVILGCPRCGELGESSAYELALTCPECAHQWTKEPARTADETISHVRALLTQQQDATRRAFYGAAALLRQIATAIDAYPDPPLQLPPDPVFSIRLTWGSVGPGGFPSTSHGWHLDGGRVGTIWNGTLSEAVEIVRKKYPPSKGTDTQFVLANAEEILSC